MSDPSLAVVVLAYGAGGEHRPLLASLQAEGVPGAAILVVHNPADAGEAAPASEYGCEILQADRNLGYAAGMNLGLARRRLAGAELLLALTHDTRLRPGSVDALLAAARLRPDCAVLGPVQLLAGTEEVFSYGGLLRPDGTPTHIRERPAGEEAGVHGCDWVDGGTVLLRGTALDQVGYFDERFWGYCEEADLCLRARRAGYGVGVVLAAEADQEPGGAKRPGAWAYLSARNGIALARRAAGIRGLATLSGRSLKLIAINLARAALRAANLRPGDRREPWALAVGTARGTIDYFRGRWGAPPPDLPGLGDLHNA
ncbi:MAG: glycosyltransferase family 2 protein [Solirubrobacterales bacterium]|nr:glycosyltransferase family 2 protein [Solirubrobacterales bacterium]